MWKKGGEEATRKVFYRTSIQPNPASTSPLCRICKKKLSAFIGCAPCSAGGLVGRRHVHQQLRAAASLPGRGHLYRAPCRRWVAHSLLTAWKNVIIGTTSMVTKLFCRNFAKYDIWRNYCFISRNFVKEIISRNFTHIKSNMFYAPVIMT